MSALRPSRRTLTKGAVWTAPAVAVGTAVPAFAISPNNQFTCGCLEHTSASAPIFSVVTAGIGKSRVDLQLGNLRVRDNCVPTATTGFTFDVVSLTGSDPDGTTYVGTRSSVSTNPLVGTAGGALSANYIFDLSSIWSATNRLATIDMVYTVSYLDWLDVQQTVTCTTTLTLTRYPLGVYSTGTINKWV